MADKAFLNGINDYKTIGDLRGCINDTISIHSLLTESFGFKKKHIRTRTDSNVTKAEIQDGWEWLLTGAKPGDRLVFHFSGHGSYVDDRDGDESEDGVDELLCLYGMDWYDPSTYLLDDELREMAKQIPEGVLVTFVLDCCHSGTGTRMVMVPSSDSVRAMSTQSASLVDIATSYARINTVAGRSRSARSAPSDILNEVVPESSDQLREASVLARFAPPPPEVIKAMHRGGSRGGFRKLAATTQRGAARDDSSMNHVLWSGSRSDQTSADAFISGDYHGAFTYYFCQTVRQHGSNLGAQKVIESLRKTLAEQNFQQVPQLEPTDTIDVVFQSRETSDSGVENETGGNAEFETGTTDPPSIEFPTAPSPIIWSQIAASLQQIADYLAAGGRSATIPGSDNNRGLVYVHGICFHRPGYSSPWWQAMSPHLNANLRVELDANRHEVLWSRHVSPSERSAAISPAASQQQRATEERLRDVLRERAMNQVSQEISRSASTGSRGAGARAAEQVTSMPRAAFGIPGLDCIDDFAKYLTNDQIRELVLEEFCNVVRPLLARGDSIEVISHSWGTVVAYEGLRSLESEGLPGRIHAWFTVGAALSISFIADRLRPSDGHKPANVDRWINLDAKSDIVGGSLQAAGLRVDQEFLDLDPTGCEAFGWPFKLYAPACAHSSYFKEENVVVNRDIFAAAIHASR